MKNKYVKFLLFVLVPVSLSFSLTAQNPVQKMIKRALEEKSFMKLSRDKIIKDTRSSENSNYRNPLGERLVRDSNSGAESEMSAAINPLDSNNIVVSTIHFAYNQIIDQPLSISTYYTKDFGNTWKKSNFDGIINSQQIVIGGGDPVLVFDAKGDLHLTYILLVVSDLINFNAKEYIYYAISHNGGETWESHPYFEGDEFNLSSEEEDYGRFLDKQWMVSDLTSSPYHGNVYLGYVDFFGGDTINDATLNIKLDVYHPGDTTFVYNPVKITSDSFRFVQFTSVDIDNDGNVYVGFVGSLDSLNYYFYNSVSNDGGQTFSEPHIISKFYFPGFTQNSLQSTIIGVMDRYFPSPYIALDKSAGPSSGRVYATWTAPGIEKFELSASDIYMSYSDDKGVTWVTPFIINNDSLINSDQFYSNLEVNSAGIPILCFYDKRQDSIYNHNTDYYIAYSLNRENPDFSTQYPITSQPSDFTTIGDNNEHFGIGEYNKTVSTKSFAIPFWADGRKNDGDLNVYMALIPLDGKEYPVGTYDINLVSDKFNILSIAPNPSNGEFSVEINLKNTTKLSVRLFDLSGKQLYYKRYNNQLSGKQTLNINLNNINTGTYFLKINTDFGYISRKIEIIK